MRTILAVAGLLAGSLVVRGQEQKTVAAPLVPAAERSASFDAVNRHLELGGALYGYVDVDGDVAKLGRGMTKLFGAIPVVSPQVLMLKQDYAQILADLGGTDIKAVGFSSVRVCDVFRNRVFIYTPGGRHGLLAGLGGAPAAFTNLKYAPADTDMFVDAEFDLPAAYAAVKTVVARVGGTAAVNALEAALQKPGHPAGLTPLAVIEKLAGRITFVERIDPAHPAELPGALSAVSLKGDFFARVEKLGPVLGALCAKSDRFARADQDGMTAYEMKEPAKAGGLRLVAAVDGDVFYIASSAAFLHECLHVKDGLADNADLKEALAVLGTQGNILSYVTPRAMDAMKKSATDAAARPGPLSGLSAFKAELIRVPAKPLVGVEINEPDGILSVQYSCYSLKPALAAMAAFNPLTIGLGAALVVPAIQRTRQVAQQRTVVNNLRQLSAAADQYMLEHGVNQAGYSDLVGPDKSIKQLHPVAGEDYTHIVIHLTDSQVEVRLPSGLVVRVPR